MSKQIIVSLSVIAVIAAVAVGGTVAYFSDTETSTGNTITAGVVDIVVDGENPWEATGHYELLDMKPSYTRYIEFTVRNYDYSNPINLWKHVDITAQTDGYITEPECTEGGGEWTGGGVICTVAAECCEGNYVERNNLAAYTIYDMYVCPVSIDPTEPECEIDNDGAPIGNDWEPIIEEGQYIRLDNISSIWIRLGQLYPAEALRVVQSYHLRSWPGASEPEVTNWAQGDELTFDIELMATQLNAPGPKGAIASLIMDNKDPDTWEPIVDNMGGLLTYNTSGSTFDYNLLAQGLAANTDYSLIYYADGYPGNNPGALIDTVLTDGSGVAAQSNNVELGMDLPTSPDLNYPAGAKVWLVPSNRYNAGTKSIVGWNPTEYLFEMQLIAYDDIDL